MSVTLTKGSLTITLRNPDFGNIQKIDVAKINQRTRGGDLIIYRDPIWPITKTISYTFTNLTQKKVDSLLFFIEATVGQNITLTDFEGTIWTGTITTPSNDIVQPGIDVFTANFDFQGSH